jgi:hypothetical protein
MPYQYQFNPENPEYDNQSGANYERAQESCPAGICDGSGRIFNEWRIRGYGV